jgi:hypothetical protein
MLGNRKIRKGFRARSPLAAEAGDPLIDSSDEKSAIRHG